MDLVLSNNNFVIMEQLTHPRIVSYLQDYGKSYKEQRPHAKWDRIKPTVSRKDLNMLDHNHVLATPKGVVLKN